MSEEYRKIPAVALRGMTILPGMVAHFDVSRNKSIKAVENAMVEDQKIFLVTQRNVNKEDPAAEDLYSVGVLAVIKQVIKLQNNVVRVLIEGEQRGFLENLFVEECLFAQVEILEELEEDLSEEITEAMIRGVKETFGRYCILNPKPGKELAKQIQDIHDLGRLLDDIGNNLPLSFEDKQQILEAMKSISSRLRQSSRARSKKKLTKTRKNTSCGSRCGSSVRNWEKTIPCRRQTISWRRRKSLRQTRK